MQAALALFRFGARRVRHVRNSFAQRRHSPPQPTKGRTPPESSVRRERSGGGTPSSCGYRRTAPAGRRCKPRSQHHVAHAADLLQEGIPLGHVALTHHEQRSLLRHIGADGGQVDGHRLLGGAVQHGRVVLGDPGVHLALTEGVVQVAVLGHDGGVKTGDVGITILVHDEPQVVEVVDAGFLAGFCAGGVFADVLQACRFRR